MSTVARAAPAIEGRLRMPVHDMAYCVQVFGLIEVEPGRNGFGLSHTYALPPGVAPLRLDGALRGPGAEKMTCLPLEWR
jgi:hypothetical protein